jgi:hypothetical protein
MATITSAEEKEFQIGDKTQKIHTKAIFLRFRETSQRYSHISYIKKPQLIEQIVKTCYTCKMCEHKQEPKEHRIPSFQVLQHTRDMLSVTKVGPISLKTHWGF